MKFKRLEVSGFKSFADKLEIKFGSGITGIVGPNGCGKSNVADAVRWVLGEQSAKLLRGHSMQDVIFNGTENRKSLSFCEVSLCFDNTPDDSGKKLFPDLEYKEVVMSRKLYRSGDSEYLLNKQNCRLKDITELLRDGGMGREGYSIIGQGRIDELLSAKPEDRRSIFEEAAGISKTKAKKLESERRLSRHEDNLSRICDILDEKGKQLEPLARQSENARKWLAYRDTLRHHEINLYIHQFDTAAAAKKVINQRLRGVKEELELKNRESSDISARYNKTMEEMLGADKKVETLREELMSLNIGIERDAAKVGLLKERSGYLATQSEKLKEENKFNELSRTQNAALAEECRTTCEAKRAELTVKREEAEDITNKYLAVSDELLKEEGESDKRHSDVLKALDKLVEIKANEGKLRAEMAGLESSADDFKKRIEFYNGKIDADTVSYNRLKSEIESRTENRDALSQARAESQRTHNEALSAVHECASKIDKLSMDKNTLETRIRMFTDMHEQSAAFGVPLKKLLSDARQNKALGEKIEGVVANILKIEKGFETAVEAALGNAVQNVVTKTETEAKELIAYLKERRYGQITFLPLNAVKPRVIDERFNGLLNLDGVLGSALNFVKSEPRFEPALRGLLGGVVFVKDMDAAVSLARASNYGFMTVTLEGDIIRPSGSITGGSKKSELTNIFGYEREIAALKEQSKTAVKNLGELTALRDKNAALKDAEVKKLQELSENIHAIDIELAAKQESFNALSSSIEADTLSVGNLEFEVLNAVERIDAINADLNSVAELETLTAAERTGAYETDIEKRQKLDALKKERNRLHELRLTASLTVSAIENDIKNCEAECERLKHTAAAAAERIEYNNRQIIENEEILEKIDVDLNAFLGDAKEDDGEKVTAIRNTLADIGSYKERLKESLSDMDTKRRELMDEIQAVLEKRNREEQLLLKVDSDIEYLEARVFEEYDLRYEDCMQFKADGYDTVKGAEEAAALKRRMSALGHINLDAIEQCKTVYEDYHILDMQKQDMVKAKADLERAIAEMSKEMLNKFTEQFELIRRNFVKIFKELFDGGTADLLLLEDENPLEAGIEIVAQPPEKKLQSISLLSGGERALTAIAILFAILRLRPMPFCILDEIEAALDDANAGRFAKYLRRFSEGTQFIVITHRKPTMELADSLYGVTMEEKGVSKIVSVKLSEAVAAAGS